MSYTKQTWTDGTSPLSAARMNNMESGIFNADFQTCTSTTRPTTGLFDGMRIYETDTKAFGFYDATAAAWHMWDTVTQTFTPGITAQNSAPTLGNGTLLGWYKRMGRHCWIKLYFSSGTTTSGGTGSFSFTIPVALTALGPSASTGEQWITAKVYAGNSVNFSGIAWASGATLLPYFPLGSANCSLGALASCTASAAAGTGTPQVSGQFTLSTGSNVTVEGVYELAAG